MKGEKLSLLQRCIKWREANIKEKQFILILSFLVGIFTAFAALILKFFIHQIQNFLTDNFNATEANYLYLVYPVVGIFLAGWFVRNIVKDDISHGVTKILYAISRRQGRIKRHNIWSSTIASGQKEIEDLEKEVEEASAEKERLMVRDTDSGKKIKEDIEALKMLLRAYREGELE